MYSDKFRAKLQHFFECLNKIYVFKHYFVVILHDLTHCLY